jgi:hypothetical protein
MNSKFILTSLFCFCLIASKAQSIEKGSQIIDLGIERKHLGIKHIGGDFELGLADNIGAGGIFTFRHVSSFTELKGAVFGRYHASEILKIKDEKIDLYTGLGLGMIYRKYTYAGSDSNLFIQLDLGGRYYFTDKLGAYGHLILAKGIYSGFGIGGSYKLK